MPKLYRLLLYFFITQNYRAKENIIAFPQKEEPKDIYEMTLEEMDAIWDEAKKKGL